MYTRDGYVSLSGLWRDFESRFLPLCERRSLERMQADPHSSEFVFGTALDLCEDAFIITLDSFQLSLVPFRGEVIQVEPVLAHSGARLLIKTTAFESVHISAFPDEAGPDGMWLRQMGSSAFRAADLGWLYPDNRGRDIGKDLETVLFAKVFHTLPILFERPTFVIAKELPPWSNDLLEETYVRTIWSDARGSSICLSDASSEEWKSSVAKGTVERALNRLLPYDCAEVISEAKSMGGRPEKQSKVIDAYQELGLEHESLSRKEEIKRIEEHLRETISMTLLDRARRKLRGSASENTYSPE